MCGIFTQGAAMPLPQPPEEIVRDAAKAVATAAVTSAAIVWQAGYEAGVQAERARILRVASEPDDSRPTTPVPPTGAATADSRPLSETGVKRAPRGSVAVIIDKALKQGIPVTVEYMEQLGVQMGLAVSPDSIRNQLRFMEKDGGIRRIDGGRWQKVEASV
jgi:hypothetical protein